jgi:hypothetical protein
LLAAGQQSTPQHPNKKFEFTELSVALHFFFLG